jgi:hypothetical protein
MSQYRIIAVAAGMVFAGVGLTACATATPATTAAPALSSAEQLTAALGKLKGQGYDLSVKVGKSTTRKASVNPSQQAAQDVLTDEGSSEGQTSTISVVQVGSSIWVKMHSGQGRSPIGLDPNKWLLLDQSKMTAPNSKHFFDLSGPDAFDVTELMTSTAGVKATDATHLSGAVDLTAATGINHPDKETLKRAGDKAKAAPFTAVLDDQGRLAELTINGDGINSDLTEWFTYSNYGSPSAITTPPTADVIPASTASYLSFTTP